jgi:NAD(P)-dependent dehydrogenase (short-subunit alcohol dehydrogenase family)
MAHSENKPLQGQVAVVTGATRNAGRGIAIELGIAGATVYCTGRSVRGNPSPLNQPETIEETAEMVDASGGKGIWVRVDHTVPGEVEALFARVAREQGRLDLLVNNVSGGGGIETPFLQPPLEDGLQQIVQGGHSHIIATYFAARRMAEAGHGLIISINDQEWDPAFYAMQKALINRLVISTADELRRHGIATLSIHPGAFFRCFKIMTEEALRTAVEQDPDVAQCHTPRLIGRAVVALASDPHVLQKTGQLVKMRDLVCEYGLTDIDGRQTGEHW